MGREGREGRGEGCEGVGASGTEGVEGVGSLKSNVVEWYEEVIGEEVEYSLSKEGWFMECR